MSPPGQGSSLLGGGGDGEGAAWREGGLWEAVSRGDAARTGPRAHSPGSTGGSQSPDVPRVGTA